MRVADYIAKYIYDKGNETVFMVSGGGAMFLNDGLAKHSNIKVVCMHHEQAAGMAAESYAKFNKSTGIAFVTSGCGGTNAITPLLGAWQDSVPCVFIAGQSKRKETIRNSGLALRQFGVQEADIISIVQSISKYAVSVNDPNEIAFHLDKAFHLALSGRPGPVWLEIPLDVQSATIEEQSLKRFQSDTIQMQGITDAEIELIKTSLLKAERPLILAGNGVILSDTIPDFKEFIEKYNIPVVFSRLGINNLPSDHFLNIGLIGNKGQRAANFAVQNADFLLVLGSRLSVSSTGHEYNLFAREAKIIVVDIDPIEHQKNTVKIDYFVNIDLKDFFYKIKNTFIDYKASKFWLDYCNRLKTIFPKYIAENAEDKDGLNLYYFVEKMSEYMPLDIAVVTDSGSTSYVVPQAIDLKINQRYITSSAQGEMGYALPGSIGVCVAKNKSAVICITGEGSLQMNIQEFQTIVHNKLPIKIFIWNNGGYLSIKTTQEKFFEGRYIGSGKDSGVSFPDLEKISLAYGLKYCKVEKSNKLKETFEEIFSFEGPVVCEVMCNPFQQIAPTVSSLTKPNGSIVSKPLEDMYPFIDRDTFKDLMIVEPLEE